MPTHKWCKHVAAAFFAVAEFTENDPYFMFKVRGLRLPSRAPEAAPPLAAAAGSKRPHVCINLIEGEGDSESQAIEVSDSGQADSLNPLDTRLAKRVDYRQ